MAGSAVSFETDVAEFTACVAAVSSSLDAGRRSCGCANLRVMRCMFWGACVILTRSWGPSGPRRRSAAAGLLGLWVRISPGAWMFVSYECGIFYRHRPLRRADSSSRGILSRVYVSLCVIRCNSNPLHLQRLGRRGRTKILYGIFPYLDMVHACTVMGMRQTGYISLLNYNL